MNVLIIGLGSIAIKHINALQSIQPNIQIHALRSSMQATQIEGVKNLYSFSDIPNLNLDFIIISNPTSLHYKTIQAVIPYKIPLFIEKPLFDQVNNEKIIDEINQTGITTYIACNLRFLDCLLFTRDFIKDKRINEVNSYCGSYLPNWRPNQNYRNTYSANKEMGGGVHIDLIHEIDYIFWFFGMPVKANSIKRNNSSLNISAYDYANYVFEYPCFCANIILNYYRKDAKRALEILTDEGTIHVDLLENKVTYNNKVLFLSNKKIADTYTDQLQYFLDNVLKKKEKFNAIDEAFQVLKLCIEKD